MIPGRMPMKPSICSGLRRKSFVRSAAVRSGLDRISMICADDSGGESCPAPVICMPRRRTTLVMIATKTSFRVIFIGLSGPPFRSADYTRNEHGARHLDEAFAQAETWTLLVEGTSEDRLAGGGTGLQTAGSSGDGVGLSVGGSNAARADKGLEVPVTGGTRSSNPVPSTGES